MNRQRLTAARVAALAVLLVAHTRPCSGESEIVVEISAQEVGKYELVEFTIEPGPTQGNPFDPDDVDLRLELDAPDGRQLNLPAFYCQQYERRNLPTGRGQTCWMYPSGQPVWKARFAPMQLGRYRGRVALRTHGGATRSEFVHFDSVASGSRGFVRISGSDPRFFEFSEGAPFFGIGQNLAFVGAGQYASLTKAEEMLDSLSKNGANYLRIWTCCEDWALAVEARKSAWGRSWSWNPPIVPLPDAAGVDGDRKCIHLAGGAAAPLVVSPTHAVALRPGTRYVFSGRARTRGAARVRLEIGRRPLEHAVASQPDEAWAAFRHEFETGSDEFWLGRTAVSIDGDGEAWLRDLSLQEAAGGAELLWEADVNRPLRGAYNPTDCFMLDELVQAAGTRGVYLQLVLITRDLYMNSLKDPAGAEYQQAIADAKNLLRYAVARWGYATSVVAWEYFNEIDPNLPTDRFYTELGRYLKQIDVYGHLRTTSTWHPSARDCRHRDLDIADVHFYLRPSDKPRYANEVEAVLERTQFLREHAPDKPAHLGEFGLANESWQPTREMLDSGQVVDFHNAIWASALSGASSTALFWWWDRLDKAGADQHYKPLADFLADVPWTTGGLRQATASSSKQQIRVVGLQGRDLAYLWLFDPEGSWSNSVVQGASPGPVRDLTLEIAGLQAGEYRVQWWDTRRGVAVAQQKLPSAQGTLRLQVPVFQRDIACRIER